jgi:hypothetical protein
MELYPAAPTDRGRSTYFVTAPYIEELIARKLSGPEQSFLEEDETSFYEREYGRLLCLLEEEYQISRLPEASSAKPALNDLLVRLRLDDPASGSRLHS